MSYVIWCREEGDTEPRFLAGMDRDRKPALIDNPFEAQPAWSLEVACRMRAWCVEHRPKSANKEPLAWGVGRLAWLDEDGRGETVSGWKGAERRTAFLIVEAHEPADAAEFVRV